MAELVKKLQLYSNTANTTEAAKIYTTTAELIPGKPNMPVVVDGIQGYVQLDELDAANPTRGRVYRNADNKTYQICSQAIVPYGEQAYTTPGAFTFTVPGGVTRLRVALTGGGGACRTHRNLGGYDPTGSTFGTYLSAQIPKNSSVLGIKSIYGVNLSFTANRQSGGYGCGVSHRHRDGGSNGFGNHEVYFYASDYISDYVNVTTGQQIPLTVGMGGYFSYRVADDVLWEESATKYAGGGFVLIAWGGEIK